MWYPEGWFSDPPREEPEPVPEPCRCCSNDSIGESEFCAKCDRELVSVCGCDRMDDVDTFRELDFVGVQSLSLTERLELRNCECGTTRGLWIDRDGRPLYNHDEQPYNPTGEKRDEEEGHL